MRRSVVHTYIYHDERPGFIPMLQKKNTCEENQVLVLLEEIPEVKKIKY